MKIKRSVIVMSSTEAKVVKVWEANRNNFPAVKAAEATGLTPAQATKIRYQYLTLTAQLTRK